MRQRPRSLLPDYFQEHPAFYALFRIALTCLTIFLSLSFLSHSRRSASVATDTLSLSHFKTYPTIPHTKFRIFDIVLYHNEAYMILLRLRTLRRWVDRHYIGFSDLSFSHEVSDPLSFAPFEDEIKSFFDHVFWMNYSHPARMEDPWERETDIRHQLIARMESFDKPQFDDLVMWSDMDEIPIPSGMAWIRRNPPHDFYRWVAHFHFYNYRWRCGESWNWAYIQKYGKKNPRKTWFQLRVPEGDYPTIPGIGMIHCSYSFPSLNLILSKLKSFSHREFASGQYVDPNYVYTYVYCGYSLFGGNYTFVPFAPLGIDFPTDPRYNYMKQRIHFNDLDQFQFNLTLLKQYSPCELPELRSSGDVVRGADLPNDIWE
jgi:hypothetical protein